nr:hypothetical protein CFP56_48406 [Quercus suber]
MGQRWRLGAWISGELRKKDGRSLVGGMEEERAKRIVWSGTRNGKFFVGSAYRSIREMGDNNGEESSNGLGMKRVWKSI